MASTIAFIPRSLSSSLEDAITTIKAAAQTPNVVSTTSEKQTNHWVFYLPTPHNTSIRFDLSPSGPSAAPACLIVSRLDSAMSRDVVKTCNISVRPGTTVKTILDILKSANYDRYTFSEGGQGCRFWVGKVVTLLQEREVAVNENEIQALHNALQQVWSSDNQPVPAAQQFGIIPGTFY